ncbi:unnamed protein product [Microthlaspi erraticum]|uniref:Retrotransposon gag domain-containing protein n=1 Tax=Microthlaspi erraticum TaxID=1685480 RepID=A0A6D2HQE2_9BRAS|nr:unnamed protein product [Microthlaspi erraticum]
MTRRSNKDNLVEHPEIDKLEKQLRKQKPKRWPTKQLALTPLKWRALNEEGRDPPPPPPNPQDLLEMNKISNFRQANNESFYEALDRFKEYIRDCPNHGFNEGNLWNIFYRGIDHKYKLSLDTASNGNFMTKTVDEAKVLIENLAASDCNNCPDYDRSSRTTTSSPDSFQMTELKNMMAQVLKGQLKHINAIEGMSDANEDSSRECMGDFSNEANEEDVNYIGNYGNKGYNPSYRPNPNMSYRNPNVENPQDQVYPPRYPQQQRPPYQSQGSQFQPRQGYEQRSSYPAQGAICFFTKSSSSKPTRWEI